MVKERKEQSNSQRRTFGREKGSYIEIGQSKLQIVLKERNWAS